MDNSSRVGVADAPLGTADLSAAPGASGGERLKARDLLVLQLWARGHSLPQISQALAALDGGSSVIASGDTDSLTPEDENSVGAALDAAVTQLGAATPRGAAAIAKRRGLIV
jgi:hypothetical protein